MIRTTISCCALFGSLLWGAQLLRQPAGEPLRPVESPPVLRPVGPAGTETRRVTDSGLRKVSASVPPDQRATVALALNQPRVGTHAAPSDRPTSDRPQPDPAVAPLQADDEALFGLLLQAPESPQPPESRQYSSPSGQATSGRGDASPLNVAQSGRREERAGEEPSSPAGEGADWVLEPVISAEDGAEEGLGTEGESTSDDSSPSPAAISLPARDAERLEIRRGNVVRFAPQGQAISQGQPIAERTGGPQRPERSGPGAAWSAEMWELRTEIRACLDYYRQRPEDVQLRSPWGVMHALIAFGVETEVMAGGRPVNAIGWLCWNQPCRGQRLFTLRNDQLATVSGPGVQGHEGQFLAMLAQSRVARDYEIRVGDRQFTIEDLIAYEQRTCVPNTELTFKLIALAHYLDSDVTWVSEQGSQWSIPRLIQEELRQPVIGAACGGTHRMMGFSYAVRKREERGEPFHGQWLRAKKFVDAYHEYALKLQNPDGSFSTNWFRGRGSSPDPQRRVQTTGHILEWLVYSLPQDQLQDPRVVRSVRYLTRLMQQQRDWEIGPRGHALHALVMYEQRVFGEADSASRRLADREAAAPEGSLETGDRELSLEPRPTLRFRSSNTASGRSDGRFNSARSR